MLLRVADHLYWMGRYIERAENTARAVEAIYPAAPKGSLSTDREWEGLLALTGRRKDFLAKHGPPSPAKILRFVLFDLENPSSLLASLRAARENGRSVSATLSPEMWESLNALWLDLQEVDEGRLLSGGVLPFIDRFKEGAHLFRGVLHSTLAEEEVFRLIDLGTFLERADHIVRILRARHSSLLREGERETHYYSWVAILRSVGALGAYRRVYHDLISPGRVAELLILREEVPCSLHACLDRINDLLRPLAGGIGPEVVRLAADLHFLLHDGRIKEILRNALHEYLIDFTAALQRLGEEIDKGLRISTCA
ncbi:MAG: alpha-E domain-containing protein [Candidatus Manganitrophaceae bacterium]|nr:MAG: alpha-E domain-containing protein [Candidatus Manganitrophaceae bacterium]